MKTYNELVKTLGTIDGKGYKAYKDIQGQYQWENFILSIDFVQADPFALPSRIRVTVPGEEGGFPEEIYNTPYKRRAVIDFLSRTIARNIHHIYQKVSGSGKSGLLAIGYCGQEILERNFIKINQDLVEARLEVGLPAAGRRILGKEAKVIFLDVIPRLVESSLFYGAVDKEKLLNQVKLVEDQYYLRQKLVNKNLVAFIANGSILPRESGVSQCPMRGAIPFKSPEKYEVEFSLPHYGPIKGMGIPKGVTLIVGGGFHGKSTLLKSLELGVYDHIASDGREYLVTRENAVKIKAEEGRSVEKVNISSFINNLPMNQDTTRFSTRNASGSTSQAANIIEALEIGTDLLLIDEDTSATNFMIRDARMQQLVAKDKEPITPFIDRVRALYEEQGVSTVLVMGGSGDYFEIADHVIMMEQYIPRDVTYQAREIVKENPNLRKVEIAKRLPENMPRVMLGSTFARNSREVKIKIRGINHITFNKTDIDLSHLEQLIDSNQTNTICFMLQYIMEKVVNDKLSLSEVITKIYDDISAKGLDILSPYKGHPGNMTLPRPYEIVGTLNRFRDLKIK